MLPLRAASWLETRGHGRCQPCDTALCHHHSHATLTEEQHKGGNIYIYIYTAGETGETCLDNSLLTDGPFFEASNPQTPPLRSPMKAYPPRKLFLAEKMCMEPPWPRQHPVFLPNSSAIISLEEQGGSGGAVMARNNTTLPNMGWAKHVCSVNGWAVAHYGGATGGSWWGEMCACMRSASWQ